MGYKAKHPLFRDLNDREVEQFKVSVLDLCRNGFSVNALTTIHPVVRKELIRLLNASLELQGEL